MVALHVEESGPVGAPPLVLLHGVANSRRTFVFAEEALGGRRRLRVDLRGHGASPRTPGAYRLDGYADDVVELLEQVGPAHVVGNSLGGVIAWTVAQRRPDLMVAALLEDPPLWRMDAGAGAALFAERRAQAARWQADGATPETIAAVLAATVGPHGCPEAEIQAPDAIDARARALLDMDPSVLDAIIDGTGLADIDLATPPAVPVRVLASDESCGSALPLASAAALVDAHPDVSVRRIAGAGHVIHDEVAHRPTWLAEVGALLDQHG